MRCLGEIYLQQAKHEEAEELYRPILGECRKFYGPTHPHIILLLFLLGNVYHLQGKWHEAIETYTEMIQVNTQVNGEANKPNAIAHFQLIEPLISKGRLFEAAMH